MNDKIRKIYEIDLYPENAVNIRRSYPAPMRSYFNVTQCSQKRIKTVATKYTNYRDAIGTLRVIAL